MDLMTETLLTQGQQGNLYFYAFTATPKPKTLQTFGVARMDGTFDAFHHYSMRQAIDEGFIMDVLKNYTTLQTAYEIAKSVKDNPEYDEPPATTAIKQYHDNHEHVIAQKVEIMAETIKSVTLNKMGGKAKAMIVTASRAHAVRYYFALKDYCKKKGYDDIRPLVAFSGTVTYQGVDYVESKLNSTEEYNISESKLPLYFDSDLYNVLIVADKYQTGFDQPRLHTMMVDKGLRGVKAVQTLSRLNRAHRDKVDTFVLDFVNTADDIQKSFQPFYEDTLLGEAVDVNIVYQYQNELYNYHLWSQMDEQKVWDLYSSSKQKATDMGKLSSIYTPVLAAFENLTEENRFKVRSLVRNFIRFYAYMAQIVRTFDKELLKTYVFAEYLFKFLPKTPHEKVDLTGKLALINNKFTESFSGSIDLNPSEKDKTLKPEKGGKGNKPEEKRDLLANIIEKINLMYAGNFTEADRVIVETIFDRMNKNSKVLKKQAKNSDANMFAEAIFPKAFEEVAQECYVEQMDAFSKLFQDEQFYNRVRNEMARAMYASLRNKRDAEPDLYPDMDAPAMAAEGEV